MTPNETLADSELGIAQKQLEGPLAYALATFPSPATADHMAYTISSRPQVWRADPTSPITDRDTFSFGGARKPQVYMGLGAETGMKASVLFDAEGDIHGVHMERISTPHGDESHQGIPNIAGSHVSAQRLPVGTGLMVWYKYGQWNFACRTANGKWMETRELSGHTNVTLSTMGFELKLSDFVHRDLQKPPKVLSRPIVNANLDSALHYAMTRFGCHRSFGEILDEVKRGSWKELVGEGEASPNPLSRIRTWWGHEEHLGWRTEIESRALPNGTEKVVRILREFAPSGLRAYGLEQFREAHDSFPRPNYHETSAAPIRGIMPDLSTDSSQPMPNPTSLPCTPDDLSSVDELTLGDTRSEQSELSLAAYPDYEDEVPPDVPMTERFGARVSDEKTLARNANRYAGTRLELTLDKHNQPIFTCCRFNDTWRESFHDDRPVSDLLSCEAPGSSHTGGGGEILRQSFPFHLVLKSHQI